MNVSRSALALLLLGSAAPSARAHNVSDETSLGATQATSTSPSTWYASDKLRALVDLPHDFDLRLDATYTYDAASPPPAGANFRSKGGNIFLLSLATDWQATKHFSFGVEGDLSPPSTTESDTSVALSVMGPGGMTSEETVDADLSSRSWSAGGALYASYDTAGDSKAESIVDLSLGANYLDTFQQISEVWSAKKNAPYAVSDLLQSCRAAMGKRSAGAALGCGLLTRLAAPHDATMVQFKAGAGLIETLYDDTDLVVNAAYYFYNTDPTQIGYFGTATRGRAPITGRPESSSSSFGGGTPIAPYVFTVQPGVTQRLGKLSAGLNFQFGQYVDPPLCATGPSPDGGPVNCVSARIYSYSLSVGVKVQYKFTRMFRLWLKADGERDIDSSGAASLSGSIALGGRLTF